MHRQREDTHQEKGTDRRTEGTLAAARRCSCTAAKHAHAHTYGGEILTLYGHAGVEGYGRNNSTPGQSGHGCSIHSEVSAECVAESTDS